MDFKSNIWKMNASEFFRSMMFFSAVSIPFFTQFGKLDFTQILFLQSWFMFWIFALEVPTGVIADRFGRKLVIILSSFAGVLATLIYGSISNFYIFMLAEFIWALGYSLLSGSDQAFIYDTLKKVKKKYLAKKVFARYTNMSMLAFMFAAPLGSLMVNTVGLQGVMLLTSVPITISGLIALTLKEPPYKGDKESTRVLKIFRDGLKIIRHNKVVRVLAIDAALGFVMYYFILWLYQPLFIKGDLNLAYWGILVSVMNIVGVVILEKINAVEKLFGRKKLVYLSVIIPALLYIASSFTSSIFIIVPIVWAIFAFSSLRRPLISGYMNHYIPSAQRATVNSMAKMLQTILIIIINPFFGMLIDFSLNTALVVLGMAGIVIGIISKFHVQDNFLRK